MLDDVWRLMDTFVHSGDLDSSATFSDLSPDHHLWTTGYGHSSYPGFEHQYDLHSAYADMHHDIPAHHDSSTILSYHQPDYHQHLASHMYGGHVVAGDPERYAPDWHLQEGMNSCAVACQTDILHSFGVDVSEHQVAIMAQEHGWYDPMGGTSPYAVGNILEAYGIPVTRSYDTSLVTLSDALNQGRRVVVGLDANEIWTPRVDANGIPVELPDAGHAVWVTGIEQNDHGKLEVILNDTGNPNGRSEHVAIEDFVNAWEDFGRQAVITNISAGGPHVA